MEPSASELVNELLDRFADWDRRPSKASSKRLDDAVRAVLRAMLQREPTADEVATACK